MTNEQQITSTRSCFPYKSILIQISLALYFPVSSTLHLQWLCSISVASLSLRTTINLFTDTICAD